MVNHLWLKSRFWFDSLSKSQGLNNRHLIEYQQTLTQQFMRNIYDADLMAIDLEMTGLDPLKDQIISIGLVPINHGSIPLAKAKHLMISIDGSVGQSAAVHGIVDHQLQNALPIEAAMAWLLEQTKGRILVAHHAPMDMAFIQKSLDNVFGQRLLLPFIDTLMIEKTRYLRQHGQLIEGCVRLGQSRERYHLPIYAGHNALIDAIACAELFLAQVSALGGLKQIKCHELVGLSK
ncbi:MULTISPECIES: exonuclease domain-containing protein [Pseudomonadati]|uniref:3'-5' exonuclease n=1 Tax=Shewanella aestuarii TaxID=1028752 RepID=A0ABT0L3J1_9GAMM|nr:exonuclease domain-containing protein [Shewanella aestuarii]MCL1118090.1 3'-5' exonuclease [Shewanella aestuarii]GGN81934.1 DNA polymerase III subunit epsilon [Shewanella aestuarii]